MTQTADGDASLSGAATNESASTDSTGVSGKTRLLNWSGLLIAFLQSACTAVIAISGVRVAIGLTGLSAAAGLHTPAHGWHSDYIRVPLMGLALLGSVLNLYVIWKARRLRNRPAAQWRKKPLSAAKLRSERFQIALAVVTLVLLAAEWITHPMVHRVPLFSQAAPFTSSDSQACSSSPLLALHAVSR